MNTGKLAKGGEEEGYRLSSTRPIREKVGEWRGSGEESEVWRARRSL